MSRTDSILAAIVREVEQNREVLDGNAFLETVTLAVRLEQRTGRVRKVEFGQVSSSSTEAGHDLRPGAVNYLKLKLNPIRET